MRRITATLGIRRRIEGEDDVYGNPTVTYGPPEDWPVYAVSPRSSAEPGEENRDLVLTGVTAFAPSPGPAPGPHDLVEHAGETWQVVGEVGTWHRNPHVISTRQRGVVVDLKRSEG